MKYFLYWGVLALLTMGLVRCSGGSSSKTPSTPPVPKVTSLDPIANDSAASTATTIFATFDQTMNVGNGSTFVTHGSQTGKLAGLFDGDKTKKLSFDSINAFKIGEKIEVTLTTGLSSTEGAALDEPFVYRFRAEVGGGSEVFDEFPIAISPVGIGNIPQSVTVGDLDGDGDLDLAVTTAGNRVRVLFNNGSGAFPAFNEVAGVVGPQSIISGDLDGDGDLDLVVGNSGATNVSILINDGTGGFTQDVLTSPVGVGFTPQTVTVGDWDGDRDLDLAVTTVGNRVRFLFNSGIAVFPTFKQVLGVVGPRTVIAGDWDGDGDLDLAVGNSGATNVGILINFDGTGGFVQFLASSPVDVNGTPQNQPQSMTAGDLDGDGDLDIAVALSSNPNVVLLENTP